MGCKGRVKMVINSFVSATAGRWRWVSILALVAALLTASPAAAFKVSLSKGTSGKLRQWRTPVVRFNLHPKCAPGVDFDSCKSVIEQGLAVWNGVGCGGVDAKVHSSAPGMTTIAVSGSVNQYNDIVWENKNWKFGQHTLAVCSPMLYRASGEIFEADITFNAKDHKWDGGKPAIGPVLVHEAGHALGIGHSLADSYMNSGVSHAKSGKGKAPADDANAACFIYPNSADGLATCSKDEQCAYIGNSSIGKEAIYAKLKCVSGKCTEAAYRLKPQARSQGQPCSHSWQCQSSLRCAYGLKKRQCAKPCSKDADCTGGHECRLFAVSPTGKLCVPKGAELVPWVGNSKGVGCKTNKQCSSGYCHLQGESGTCETKCLPGRSNQCSAATVCVIQTGVSWGLCLPEPLSNGTPCSEDFECESGLCAGPTETSRRCAAPCAENGDCVATHACNVIGDGGTCQYLASVPPGALCSQDKLCATGRCVDVGTGKRCAIGCQQDGECNKGEQCDGDTKVCKPAGSGQPFGSVCIGDSSCASGLCAVVGDAKACSKLCAGSAECPCGMGCEKSDKGESFCMPGQPKKCVQLGAACGFDQMCASMKCRFGLCVQPCEVLTSTCPGVLKCLPGSGQSANGICAKIGSGEVGQACGANTECQTLLCSKKACRRPCAEDAQCNGGQVCTGKTGALSYCEQPPAVEPDIVETADSQSSEVQTQEPAKVGLGCSASSALQRRALPPMSFAFAWLLALSTLLLTRLARRHRVVRHLDA